MNNIYNSHLICVQTGTSMKDAKNLMTEKRIRHLPIVNSENKILGMLSRHDLTDVPKFQDVPVDYFSTMPVKTVLKETPLSAVALKFIEEKISSVLLCDDKNNAIGIITTDDLLFQFAQILKEKESKSELKWDRFNILTTAGEFFRRLSDIGI